MKALFYFYIKLYTMNIKITAFFCLLTTILMAQTPIEKTVGEFKELKVYDLIEVELIKSDVDKVVVSGNYAEDVVFINRNGKLKVRMTLDKVFKGDETAVKVYYTNIDIIDVNEGAFVASNDTIKQFELDLNAQEGGEIKVNTEVRFLNIDANTGGIVRTSGTATNQDIAISTGGVVKNKELQTENTKIIIRAAGDAHVVATKLFEAKIRAGGNIFVYGKPETIDENKVFGGHITYIEE